MSFDSHSQPHDDHHVAVLARAGIEGGMAALIHADLRVGQRAGEGHCLRVPAGAPPHLHIHLTALYHLGLADRQHVMQMRAQLPANIVTCAIAHAPD